VPVDPAQPQTWAANFKDRETKIGAAQAWIPDLGPVSALRPDEAKAVGTMLTTGDPKAAAQLLGSLQAGLSHENWRATMESEPIKAAVVTMFNSNDPARLDAAGRVLERLEGTNSADFAAKYGPHALERLKGWQGLAGFSPEERAAKMQRADDPNTAKGRDEVGKAVDKEFANWTPQNTADALGNFFQRNVAFVHVPLPRDRLLGNEVAAQQLNADFKDTVRNLRVYYGLDQATAAQKAVEMIGAKWRPSDLNGGTLMRNAPEAFYPTDPLTKDQDWMRKQLEDEITAVHGPQQRDIVRGDLGVFGGVREGWRLAGIVADPQTQREAEAFESRSRSAQTTGHVLPDPHR
jgi:hypothetical protein